MNKIVIVVSGGLVTDILSNDSQLDVTILDYDNIEEENKEVELDRVLQEAELELSVVY